MRHREGIRYRVPPLQASHRSLLLTLGNEMGPAVGDLDPDAARPTVTIINTRQKQCTSSSVSVRYQHYCKELALLLLRHGCAHVQLSLRIIHLANTRCTDWLSRHSYLAQRPVVLLRLVVRALHQLQRATLRVARPLGQFLSQLASIQIRISTNDDLDDQTKASARINSAVSMLFGAIK